MLLAALGVLLLRRRGLSRGGRRRPVPGRRCRCCSRSAAALVVLRLFPWPLRQAGRLAARARGAVRVPRPGPGRAAARRSRRAAGRARRGDHHRRLQRRGGQHRRRRPRPGRRPARSPPTRRSPAPVRAGHRPAPRRRSRASRRSPACGPHGAPLRTGAAGRPRPGARARRRRPAAGAGAAPTAAASLRPAGRADRGRPRRRPAARAGVARPRRARSATVARSDVQGTPYRLHGSPRSPPTSRGWRSARSRFVVLPWQALPEPADQPSTQPVPGRRAPASTRTRCAAPVTPGSASTGERCSAAPATGAAADPVTTWAHRRAPGATAASTACSASPSPPARPAAARWRCSPSASRCWPGRRRAGPGAVPAADHGTVRAARAARLLVYELVPLVGVAVLAGGLVGRRCCRGCSGRRWACPAFTGGVAARTRSTRALVGGVLAAGRCWPWPRRCWWRMPINRRLRLGEALRLGEEN